MTSMVMPGGIAVRLGVMLWLAGVGGVAAQPNVPLRESVATASSPTATRQLATLLNLAESENWSRVQELLSDLERRESLALVEVEPRRVVRVAVVAQVIRSQLAANGAWANRAAADSVARVWLDEARTTGDARGYLRILQSAADSSWVEAAVNELAEQQWRVGNLDSAAAGWNLLSAAETPSVCDPGAPLRIGATKLSAADLAARRVLVEAMDRDFMRAAELLGDLAREHPDAAGSLAGSEGPLLESLREILSQERSATALDRASGRFPTAAGGIVHVGAIDVGHPLWRRELSTAGRPRRLSSHPAHWNVEPPELLPVVNGDRIFWSSIDDVRAMRADGRPLWPAGEEDRDQRIHVEGLWSGEELQHPAIGDGLRTVAMADGRLFAVMGAGIAVESEREPRPIESRLVCLDIATGEGKPLWSVSPLELLPEAGWRFSGPPLATSGRVLIAVRRSQPAMAIGVASVEADTGRLQWVATLAGLLTDPPEVHHILTADELIADSERVYLPSACGCVGAIRVATGDVDWIRRDDPQPWGIPPVTPVGEAAGRLAVLHRGRLYTRSHDQQTVQCLDARTGSRLWTRWIPTRVDNLIGVRCGVLVATGRQAWGVDIDTGELRWRAGVDDVEAAWYGRGVIAGESVWTCSHDELWEIGVATGEIRHRVPLWEGYGVRGGHVIVGERQLLIASPRELVAFELFR